MYKYLGLLYSEYAGYLLTSEQCNGVVILVLIKGKLGTYPSALFKINSCCYRAVLGGLVIREIMEMTEVGIKNTMQPSLCKRFDMPRSNAFKR